MSVEAIKIRTPTLNKSISNAQKRENKKPFGCLSILKVTAPEGVKKTNNYKQSGCLIFSADAVKLKQIQTGGTVLR